MSRLEIKISEVKRLSSKLGPDSTKMSSIADSINSVRGNLDSRITARKNIGSRLSSAYNEAKSIETKLKMLEKFIDDSMDRYEKAETKVNKEAEELIALWNIEYGGEFALEWRGMMYDVPGNSALNEEIYEAGNENFEDIGSEIEDAKREQKISYTLVGVTGLSNMNSEKFLITNDGMQFKLFKQNGQIWIKVVNGGIENQADFSYYRGLLKDGLGGKWKWNKDFVKDLVNDGVPLYSKADKGFFKRNTNKFLNTKMGSLDNYIGNIGKNPLKVGGDTWANTFKENMNVKEAFAGIKNIDKDASLLTKAGKFAGPVGILLTVGDDAYGEFYGANANRSMGEKVQDTVIDVGVDLGTGSAAMATGAAVGSFFLPPLGTVVGVGVGALANMGMNYKFGGPPPESIVDRTKDEVKDTVKSAEKFGGWVKDKIGKYFW
ncbi:hypothetical protein [Clostridium hydrogenum]|uniref:hypothetical protein n=1 Tax=Clostridium hydrogenum TaxID=2855764 RepID=UPI001F169ADA|nr:hypothetical protein [Clostridium hydrogenum]